MLDQRGKLGLKSLSAQRRPDQGDMESVLAEADRRGFGGQFPQLLLGAMTWFPFERNLIIEEPNWIGKGALARYGSCYRLVDEISAVRAAIADVDPSVMGSSEAQATPERVFLAAWQTSATTLRLATVATQKRLPLITTG